MFVARVRSIFVCLTSAALVNGNWMLNCSVALLFCVTNMFTFSLLWLRFCHQYLSFLLFLYWITVLVASSAQPGTANGCDWLCRSARYT
jgi:hypothetical protein